MTAHAPRITVVGLGPGNPELRTLGTQRAIDAAERIILRTRIHPGLGDLAADPRVTDCDDLYESAGDFADLYPAIAQRVLSVARTGESVVFAVPGHPRFGEKSVPLVEAGARDLGISVDVLDAVSFLDSAAGAIPTDPLAEGLQLADAEELAASVNADPFASGRLGIDATRPLLVGQLYNRELASATKIALSRVYPDDHWVILVQAAGISGNETVRDVRLHELDRHDVDHLASLWVPPLGPLDAVRSPESLTRIVALLRAPGGCPWDRAQTPQTLRNQVLEEAYEVVDAIDAGDQSGLVEELGDLLLLISMQAQIAEENGTFLIEDVFEGVNRKLIRRHPHVFGSGSATTPEAVIATWEGVKEIERAEKGERPAKHNPIDRLPRAMPITRKAAEIFAPRTSLASTDDPDAGDELLNAVRVLIERGLDPDVALEVSLRKLIDQRIGVSDGSVLAGIEDRQGRESA
ncbi:MAG: putative tetrapyrrole (corrin/porphyrin) methylase [Thermomicrobiales bacterium]|jgi:tetrapyrrole methylase family protein/MazG family protein|nr:putative tetrapyrrole (corrin/porphyrin) methylase [Thermomicrobiales bacterium]